MEDPNITMEVNIRLEEKKACRHAIVFNDELTSEGGTLVIDTTAYWTVHNRIIKLSDKNPADKSRLEIVFGRPVNQVHVLDFAGLTEEMRQNLADRLRMVYIGDEGQELFTSHALRRLWSQAYDDLEIVYFSFGIAYCEGDGRGWIGLLSMDQAIANVPYMLAQYLFRHAEGREIGARMLGGHFIGRLAAHFGMVDEGASVFQALVVTHLNHLFGPPRPRIIMEYLVKISKKARILKLKRRNMKKLILTSYTPTSRYAPGLGNEECSNCKFFSGKIKVLDPTLELEMHPENHTLDSSALLHELYNDMGKFGLE
ncbi:hypothetical protein Tco_0538596 [Tanacetum coccineum]